MIFRDCAEVNSNSFQEVHKEFTQISTDRTVVLKRESRYACPEIFGGGFKCKKPDRKRPSFSLPIVTTRLRDPALGMHSRRHDCALR